jgi:class 3 adenylate cyclase
MDGRKSESNGTTHCPTCGAPNQAAARFCDQCGRPLAVEPGAADDREVGDRRIVSALFADIVDYSRMVSELDAEDVAARIDETFGRMAAAVEGYGGIVEKFIGDAVFAVFGARRVHDDDPLRAALCALAMMSALADAARLRGEPPLRLRVGLATGEVVTSVRTLGGGADLAVTGDTVTTAMRLQELAEPGEILLDDATLRAARNRLDADFVGERILRGRADAVRVHRLRGERPQRLVGSSGEGILVGRVADRARLLGALDTARRTGAGRVVLVVGEAGIGKSRLVADLEDDARALGFAWTWTENLSYRSGEYYAFARSFAQRIADERGTDSGSTARQLLFPDGVEDPSARRLAGAIAALSRLARFSGWETEAAFVPPDPARVPVDLGDVAEVYIRRLVEVTGPRVIIVDDLNWMDASSAPLFDRLVRTVADLPCVVLATSRPGRPAAWTALPHVEVVVLGGLDSRDTERLAAAVAGAELAEETVERLQERTGGNPLFVGETVRALVEDGALVLRDGRLHLRDPQRVGRVPVNLRALLGARIDALPADARAVLHVASVVGMSFDPTLVARLMGRPSVAAQLAVLADAAVAAGETDQSWRFRHPLIHDVAYAGMLSTRRRELHAALADHLDSVQPPTPVATLAHHRAAAGDRERAVPLLLQAADAALAVGAAAEAAGYWRTVLGLIGDDPAADGVRGRIASAATPPAATPPAATPPAAADASPAADELSLPGARS